MIEAHGVAKRFGSTEALAGSFRMGLLLGSVDSLTRGRQLLRDDGGLSHATAA